MMFQWSDEMIRFMRDAAEYSDYYQRLAEEIYPCLKQDAAVCDAGCGLGELALALAPHVGQVTAVDVNSRPLEQLGERCRGKRVDNLHVRCGDVFSMVPEIPYDAMVFCFFGSIEEVCAAAKRQCRGKVFVVTKNYSAHRFSVGNYGVGEGGFSRARKYLSRLNIPFREKTLELELGQPFRSLGEARRFFEIYSRDPDKGVITDAFLRSRLVPTEDGTFPLYMPHLRKIGWLQFESRDIPAMDAEPAEIIWKERKS